MTLVTIYLWIIAIASLLVGAVFVISTGSDEFLEEIGLTSGELLTIGIIEILIGFLVVWAAVSLGRGGDTARMIVAAVMVIRVIAAVVMAVYLFSANYAVAGVVQVVVPILIIWALYTERADEFFAAN